MPRIILIFLLLIISQWATSQKIINPRPASKLLISPLNSKVLYVDRGSLVGIKTGNVSDSLSIKLSQGDFTIFDKNVFLVQPTKIGTIIVYVYKQISGKSILLGNKSFKVLLTKEQKTLNSFTLKPEISLSGYGSGKIPIDIIKKATGLTINNAYRIKSAIIYISGLYNSDTQVYTLTSNLFDENILRALERLSPNTIIKFDNIQIFDIKGRLYNIPPIDFIVREN